MAPHHLCGTTDCLLRMTCALVCRGAPAPSGRPCFRSQTLCCCAWLTREFGLARACFRTRCWCRTDVQGRGITYFNACSTAAGQWAVGVIVAPPLPPAPCSITGADAMRSTALLIGSGFNRLWQITVVFGGIELVLSQVGRAGRQAGGDRVVHAFHHLASARLNG